MGVHSSGNNWEGCDYSHNSQVFFSYSDAFYLHSLLREFYFHSRAISEQQQPDFNQYGEKMTIECR